MSLRDYPNRVLILAILSSLLVLSLSFAVAILLFYEQSGIADIVEENVGSQQAAMWLKESLTAMILLHENEAQDVAALQEKAETHLNNIQVYADKKEELKYVDRIAASYKEYQSIEEQVHQGMARNSDVVRHLLLDTLPACQKLQDFNTSQVNQSLEVYLGSIYRLTGRMAIVGGLGSLAGLILGYGIARGLKQTIHQFFVRIEGTADLLGRQGPMVELLTDGKPLSDRSPNDGIDELLSRIEHAVTRLQKREKEVHRVEQLAALGQLGAGVAHEIRNPLTAILLLFQTARLDPTAGGLTHEDLELIEEELHRMERSIQVFLNYARPSRLRNVACDLSEIIRAALALTNSRIHLQSVNVQFDSPDKECLIVADKEQLQQVALNLILNALDVMPFGGKLHIVAKILDDEDVVELTVEDEGAGISQEILPKLFEPFATGKETGIGLGLVTSKRIIEEHGGSISGTNRPDGGAVFVVRLPRNAHIAEGADHVEDSFN